MPNLYFSIAGFFCAFLILMVLMAKKTDIQKENRFYYIMTVTSFFDCLLSILILFIAYVNYNDMTRQLIILLNKIDFIHYIVWPSMLFLYVFYVIYEEKKDLINKVKKIVFSVDIVAIIIQFFLPIDPYNVDGAMTILGPGTIFVYLLAVIYFVCDIVLLLKNKKQMFQKKFLPILFLFIFLFLALYVRSVSPTLIIIPAIIVYINMIMFFTIENPDIKLLEEVSKIKQATEKSNEEKNEFIYLVTDEVNSYINNIEEKLNIVLENKKLDKTVKEELKSVKDTLYIGKSRLKGTLDISDIDMKNFKIVNNKYNIINLVGSISHMVENKFSDDVDFRLNIADNLPYELYGDSIKLKQIILSLLDNSIKNTKKGFIELRINPIIKNQICRLVISVEDSGSGISVLKQDEILNNHDDLSINEIDNKDNLIINLKTINKIVKLIGGTLSIKSVDKNGTTVTVVLDQKVVEASKSETEKNIDKYSEVLKERLVGAIINDSKNDNKVIKSALKKFDYTYTEFDVTKNCLDKIRENVNYDVIFIYEDMEKIDAKSFYQKVKAVESFKGKIIVLTKTKEIKLRKELLDFGFDGVIGLPLNKNEVINILESL